MSVGGTIVNITGHVGLAVRCSWCRQIGSARSESKIVTAVDVSVIRVAAVFSGELLEIGVKVFLIFLLANLLRHEESGADNDCDTY